MLRKIIATLVWIPLAAILIVFAVANRHIVTVSLDPFDGSDPALAVSMPLFLVLIVVALIGVVAGGTATWLRQGRWRRAARNHQADAREAKAELAALRAQVAATVPGAYPLLSDATRDKRSGAL
jgi:uncharacterized integral membrane protein